MTSGLEGVRGLVEEIAHQKPEKPDYWNSCSQCESNIDRAQAALAAEGVQAGEVDGEPLARRFHETYERLAPSFGYETRTETRKFDPESANGRLMIAVCAELSQQPEARVVVDEACDWHQRDEGSWWYSSACGHEYIANDCEDGEVGLPYCPFCAKPLRSVPWSDSAALTGERNG